MRLSPNSLLSIRNLALGFCFLVLGFTSAHAQVTPDNEKIWTTVGSDGTVDEDQWRRSIEHFVGGEPGLFLNLID